MRQIEPEAISADAPNSVGGALSPGFRPLTAARAEEILADLPPEPDPGGPRPRISVCLLAYNHRPYVGEALESVLTQRIGCQIEVVVGDDASEDGTREIVASWARRDLRVRALRPVGNLGHHTGNGRLNFVRTLRAARGELLALLDGDDRWTDPDKLQLQADLLDRYPDCAGSFHATAMTEADGITVRRVVPSHALEQVGIPEIVSAELCFHTSSLLFRRSALPERFPDAFYQSYSGDLPLFVLLARQGPFVRLSGTRSLWRRHAAGLSMRDSIRGAAIHLERIRLWESLRPLLDEPNRSAVDRACEFHRRKILDEIARLEKESRDLRRLSSAARRLASAPLRALREFFRSPTAGSGR
jgi:glycosyltransferase involved in cell wall biosynthesis